jgi:hypothetical protein
LNCISNLQLKNDDELYWSTDEQAKHHAIQKIQTANTSVLYGRLRELRREREREKLNKKQRGLFNHLFDEDSESDLLRQLYEEDESTPTPIIAPAPVIAPAPIIAPAPVIAPTPDLSVLPIVDFEELSRKFDELFKEIEPVLPKFTKKSGRLSKLEKLRQR